jgi:amidohydrolase
MKHGGYKSRLFIGGGNYTNFLEKRCQAPSFSFFLGSSKAVDGVVYPHHNSKFDVDESVFWQGTALLAQGAVDWLKKTK